jgi:hypothetical protein
MGKSHHHEWINRRSHFAWSAAQLCYWTRLTICSIAVAVALAWTGSLAAAQQEVCKNLDAALKDEKASPPKLNELAATPSPMRVKTSEFASGSAEAIVTFEDSRIGTDMSKVCVKAFARLTRTNEWEPLKDWEPATVRRVFVTEKAGDTPRRLNVVLKIEEPKDVTVLSPSRKFDYLLVGVLGDTSPISFSYAQTISVMSKSAAVMLAVLFVLGFYLFLVYITYNDDTRSLDGPGWFAYTFSPIRISAAWFGEASMSQVQLLVFTFIVAGLLFYHWLISRVLSEMSLDLLTLIGISAVGTGASKFAQTVKTSLKDQTASYLIGKGWYNWEPIPARSHATLGKLLLTDGRLDIYKFQMAIFTVVVAFYVISAGQQSLVDVKISETMLYLIGISQGVYVGGKAITDRTTDLEAAVAKMIDLDSKIAEERAKTAPNATQLGDWEKEYARAASTAAVEFTSLQNRKFPTKFDKFKLANRRITTLKPEVDKLRARASGGGAALTSDEQALDNEFKQLEMTAKELAAYSKPPEDTTVQDVKNIDPAVLKP